MKIQQIITLRNEPWCGVDYDLVQEWENQFADGLKADLYYDTIKLRSNRIISRVPWLADLLQTHKPALKFRMLPLGNPPGDNKKNIYPIIIDFYLHSDDELSLFYKTCDKNPIIYISSKEVFDFLKAKGCPLTIKHLPISLPDKYRLTSLPTKKYDVVMLGRQNKTFKEYLDRYAINHSDFVYVFRDKSGYITSQNELLGELADRESYWNLMRSAKVGLYATPGMDNARQNTNGFSQVTPRFLEYLAAGCHVVARYKNNSDTEFFELNEMSTRVQSYDDFSHALNRLLHSSIPMTKYQAYLNRHYTSNRIDMLLNEHAS